MLKDMRKPILVLVFSQLFAALYAYQRSTDVASKVKITPSKLMMPPRLTVSNSELRGLIMIALESDKEREMSRLDQ